MSDAAREWHEPIGHPDGPVFLWERCSACFLQVVKQRDGSDLVPSHLHISGPCNGHRGPLAGSSRTPSPVGQECISPPALSQQYQCANVPHTTPPWAALALRPLPDATMGGGQENTDKPPRPAAHWELQHSLLGEQLRAAGAHGMLMEGHRSAEGSCRAAVGAALCSRCCWQRPSSRCQMTAVPNYCLSFCSSWLRREVGCPRARSVPKANRWD